MADYLCDEEYAEITSIPSTVESVTAVHNIDQFMETMSLLILARFNFTQEHPDKANSQTSRAHLPYLMTESLGDCTVLDFLQDTDDETLYHIFEEMGALIVPVVEHICDDQLHLAYKRLSALRNKLDDNI